MINKAINQQDSSSVDSLKFLKKRLTNYLTIGGVVLGTTVASMNAANAQAINQNATVKTAYIDIHVVTLNASTAITTLAAATDEATSFVTTATTATAWGITAGTLTVDGTITTAGTAPLTITLSGTGNLTINGATVEDNAANAAMTLALGGNTFTTTGAVTHVLKIAGAGTVAVNNNTTFSDSIGAGTAITTMSVATGKTGTFSETVTAGTVNSVGTSVFKKAVVSDVVTTGTITFDQVATGANAGDISESSGATSVMNVISTNGGAATVSTFTGTVAVDTLNIGTNALSASAVVTSDITATTINIVGGNHTDEDNLLTAKGNITGNVVMADNAGTTTLAVFGTAAQTITGTITAVEVQEATLNVTNVSGKEVKFTGAVGTSAKRLLDITTSDGAKTTFDAAVFSKNLTIGNDAAGLVTTFEAAGSIIGTLSGTAGAITLAGGEIRLGTAIASGDVMFDIKTGDGATGAVVVGANTTFIPSSNLTSGSITLFDGNDDEDLMTNSAELAKVVMQDTILTDFSASIVAKDVVITATQKSDNTIASTLSVTTNRAKSLSKVMDAAATDSVLLAALDGALVKVGGTTQVAETKEILLQTSVQTDTISGSAIATRAMTGTVQGIVSNRMASLRSGDAFVTGMSAGNGMSANSGFIQAFGSEAEQEDTGPATAKVFGYDSTTSGVAIGFDGMTDTGETIGLSASFSTTDVDGKGTGKSKNSIDSYTVSLYADRATDIGYLEGSLTYGINDNSSSRLVDTAGLSRSYTANYDSNQLSLKVGGGAPNEVMDGTFVTPFASATGTLITTDAYTEISTTASDALRLTVAQDDITSLVGTVGVKAHMITDNGTPMISLSINNEFGDDTINSNNTYSGGGTAFTTSTDVEELSATLGLGYSFGNDVTSLNLNYEANANEDDYVSHYGTVKIVAKF